MHLRHLVRQHVSVVVVRRHAEPALGPANNLMSRFVVRIKINKRTKVIACERKKEKKEKGYIHAVNAIVIILRMLLR